MLVEFTFGRPALRLFSLFSILPIDDMISIWHVIKTDARGLPLKNETSRGEWLDSPGSQLKPRR